ncbi:LacI family DNA-binding transcriptional regulator, partial [Streptomyces spongiae]|uniref:LacI family DNA-binding transcriptional regulator n=1 Tax=Streptomyces spongiae TaxID=565072 RepID=UPI001D13AB30
MGSDMTASKGRVTIREVAERAGVSVATVSRVLSGNYPVPPATRARVLRAARDLDYVANAHARALVGGGRKMVAVVLRQVTSPFYAQVAEGVEAEAAARGWLCLVGTTGDTTGYVPSDSFGSYSDDDFVKPRKKRKWLKRSFYSLLAVAV